MAEPSFKFKNVTWETVGKESREEDVVQQGSDKGVPYVKKCESRSEDFCPTCSHLTYCRVRLLKNKES